MVFQRELEILTKLTKCTNVIKLIELIKTDSAFYLVFEYCSGGDLENFIKKKGKVKESEAQRIMKGIANGLFYLR